ncbi:hypothetical protein BDQ17DRAFT_1240476 [Cyathus striatus]|nr:hypothetical protein BDQ17DRAFT_1240476 [Cyathus striatus]
MQRIETNPAGETCPDFSGDIFEDMCNMARGGNEQMTDEEAIEKLVTTWHATHWKKMAAWEAQVQAENEERWHQQPEEEPQAQQPDNNTDEQQENRDDEEGEVRPKKVKPFIFDANTGIETMPLNRPAQYAITKLKDRAYVEMDYFTPRGCSLAKNEKSTSPADTLGFTANANGTIALQPLSVMNPLKNICQDAELSWSEVNKARHAMMRHMVELGAPLWPNHIIQAFADFFGILDAHPIREQEYGDETIVKYQAIVRREWHDRMELGRGMNLGIVNNNLLQQIQQDIVIQNGADKAKEVSTPPQTMKERQH